MSSITWPKVSSVVEMLACLNISCTNLGCLPAMWSIVAHVCRRSCNTIFGGHVPLRKGLKLRYV